MTPKAYLTDTCPDAAELRALLTEFYTHMFIRLTSIGGPLLDAADYARDSVATIDQSLPPHGALALVRDATGALIGCGSMRRLDATRGEMKRLYVAPAARGLGLGRALVQLRLDTARAMGLRSLYADTMRGNSGMLTLYDSFGFRAIDRYEGNANPVEYDRYLVYRRLDLGAKYWGI